MVAFGRAKRAKTKPSDAPRVVVVFGLPLSGTTSAINVLREASETPTSLVLGLDEAEIRKQLREGSHVVFVDDFEPTVENVQWLNDMRFVSPAGGALVRMWSFDEDILARADVNKREDVTKEYLDELRQELVPVEERIRQLSMPYFFIPNGLDFAMTVAELARKAGILER